MRFFAASMRALRDAAGLADGLQPGGGAVMPTGAEPTTCGRRPRTRGRWRCRRDGCGDRRAVERGIELAPFACRHDRAGGQAHRLEHHADADRIGREHLAQQRDRGLVGTTVARRLHRACWPRCGRKFQHGAGQHVLGFGMGRHAEARHVDADDAHAVDLLGQQLQRHAARPWWARTD
jgi:hypothetical protein